MYQAPHNRALFKKKASAARDKLMEMGGVQKGLGSMQRPPMPGGPSGIMASSPDLMQAAMRKAPVLPTQQGAAPQPAAPAPAPAPTPLPPSQPMPNIAGIAPVPTNQPQPAKPATPAKQPVKKMQEGGAVDLGHYDSPILRKKLQESKPGTTFKDALNTTQKAITSQDPEKLGVPKELQAGMKERKELMEKDPDAAGAAFVDQNLTPEETTGDLKKDLKKVATKSGVTDIPTSATVDQLNQAIAGAKLGAAIAGNYVNPQTGQAVRPTAGARIGQAVAEGLAVKRDTAEKREAAEQAMKLQAMKNAGKSTTTKSWWDSGEGKFYKEQMAKYSMSGRKTMAQAHEEFAIQYPDIAARAMQMASGGMPMPGGGDTDADTSTRDSEPSANEAGKTTTKRYIDRSTGKAYEVTEEGKFYVGDVNPGTKTIIAGTETRVKVE